MNHSILIVVIAVISGIVYSAYRENESTLEIAEHYHLVSEFFVGQTINKSKPFLWMHANNEVNARNWESFYSRNSTKLNQPYLYITMKSIYDKCSGSFNVCLIDDSVFARLIPRWKLAVETLPSPMKENYRALGLTSLVYYYGGVSVAPSMLCLKDFYPLYVHAPVVARDIFLAGRKNCHKIRELMDYQKEIAERDYSADHDFHTFKNPVPVLDGSYLGTISAKREPILIQHLLGTSPVDIHRDAYAIYLPSNDILNRTAFNWFARMSVEQILNSALVISKFIIASY